MVQSVNSPAVIFGTSRINSLARAIMEANWGSGGRPWHVREQARYALHPAVLAACELANPKDWHELVLQWPHMPIGGEPGRLAYTQDEKKGIADRQTVTSIGKYLTRHFKLADHVIRGLALRYSMEGIQYWGTTEEIVRAITEGPQSCMRWDEEDCRFNGKGHHPYEVYSPEYGWKIAARFENGHIVGRALLLDDGTHKCFVRTYQMNPGGGYSQRDYGMEDQLIADGWKHRNSWPNGAKLAKIRTGRGDAGYLLPYIDGGTQAVTDCGDCFRIEDGGEIQCDNTDGTGTYSERETCSCCGSAYRDTEDGIWVGRYGDEWVGPCCTDDYTRVYGRRGEEYYIPERDAVEANGDWYDPDYLSDNDIVELSNGDYCHQDNCFYCPILEEHFHIDEGVHTEDEGTVHQDETWTCAVSGDVYSNNTESVEDSDGNPVHPDNVEEDETTE